MDIDCSIQRDGQGVRLFTRNGHDWSDRFPLITALRNRNSSFVLIVWHTGG